MKPRAGQAAALLLPGVVVAASLAAVTRPDAHPVPASLASPVPVHATLDTRWRVGVREPGAPASWAPVATFSRATGVRPDIVLSYSGWRQPFPRAAARTAARHHAIMLVQLEPWGASLSALARGRYDGYLRSFAARVRSFGHPVILGFGHEMNGPWYPWGLGRVPPAVFVAAWRHVVTVFRAAGADNVTWLWTIHHSADEARLRAYWPGNRYVTWIGIDGYYEFPRNTFAAMFGHTARALRRFTGKPILVSEAAVGPGAGRVPAKIRQLIAGARRSGFTGLVWFDVAQHAPPYHQDWRIEDKRGAIRAFRGAARKARAVRR